MSYIPDCRTDEFYNEDKLNEQNKEEIRGFDWCAEMVVDNFFDNMDVPFSDESYIMHLLSEEVPESMQETYTFEFSHGENEPQERTVKTYADLLRLKLIDWIEGERNELIVSMIDGQASEDELPVTDDISKV